ncbi:MAG: carboxy terminal-processing peptidase [Planctomycetota bacterium]
MNRITRRTFRIGVFAIASSVIPLLGSSVHGEETIQEATAKDEVVSRLVAKLMPTNHISGHDVDDEISRKALDLFVNSFDPLKLYFLQQDIEIFQRYATVIDDQVKAGDLRFAYYVYKVFVTRVGERVDEAMKLLGGDFDFERDETIVIDGDAAQYATNADEARDRWRRQIKFALLDLKDDETVGEEARGKLKRRYQRFARRWQGTSTDELLEMFLTSVTTAYDPHSTYMSPATLEDFAIQMRLNLDGIGAALQEKDGTTVVSNVIPGGAADLHGKLKPDDEIISVGQGPGSADGSQVDMVDILEMPLKEVVKLIRGKAGTTVRLGVRPGGSGKFEIYQIVRARVELEDSAARGEVLDHSIPEVEGSLKIGYITLPSFYMDMESAKRNERDYRSSTRDVARILSRFREENVAGVVLDLTRNGGGSLTEAISLTGLFIDRGPVVQVKSSNGEITQYDDEVRGTAWDGPLVVMTSKLSASASEIFAGAIKDYRRGIVVGDPATHGKGTVQTLMDIGESLFGTNRSNFGALKVTLQQFYLPDGESTQLEGVDADVIIPSMFAKMDIAEGDLEYALEHDTVRGAEHTLYSMAPSDLINRLRESSSRRVAADKEFQDLLRRIDLYVQRKDQDTLSLQESKFMQRRAELDAMDEDEKREEELERRDTDVIFRDTFYNKEAINIAHEYILSLRAQNLAKAR